MIKHAIITVVLSDKTVVQYNNTQLLEVVIDCLWAKLAIHNPLLIRIGTDYSLYFNTTLFAAWVKRELTTKELFDACKVTNLVRNTETIIIKDTEVDKGALWKLKDKICILADADSFLATKFDNRFLAID